MSRLNPKIVYCAITGYGKRGPLVDQADHDIGYVSLAGITSMSGEPEQAGDTGYSDGGYECGPLMAGMSILMAVRHAEQTGPDRK